MHWKRYYYSFLYTEWNIHSHVTYCPTVRNILRGKFESHVSLPWVVLRNTYIRKECTPTLGAAEQVSSSNNWCPLRLLSGYRPSNNWCPPKLLRRLQTVDTGGYHRSRGAGYWPSKWWCPQYSLCVWSPASTLGAAFLYFSLKSCIT